MLALNKPWQELSFHIQHIGGEMVWGQAMQPAGLRSTGSGPVSGDLWPQSAQRMSSNASAMPGPFVLCHIGALLVHSRP
jgi:hypothetical protein